MISGVKKILVVPDKFRPKLTAIQVCQIVKQELHSKFEISSCPLADGGQGSLQAIEQSIKTTRQYVQNVLDPLSRPIQTFYLVQQDERTAYIEMAKASGLGLLKKQQRNPLKTSTVGTGQLMRDAIQRGCKQIILFIGGSATNQAGIGAASALGYKFYGPNNHEICKFNGQNLQSIAKISKSSIDFSRISIKVCTDVNNPLLGPTGATHIFGPQKGATKRDLEQLERGMQNLNEVLIRTFGKSVGELPGGGAAGGLGAGAAIFFNAAIKSGADQIIRIAKIKQKVMNSDLVITGQGKVDGQTLHGKLIKKITDISKEHNKPVVIFCGKSEIKPEDLGNHVTILQNQKDGMTNQYSIANAQMLLRNSIRSYFHKI